MPDYNIYIHAYGGNSGGDGEKSPTRPWDNQVDSGDSSVFKSAQQLINQGQEIASSGFGSLINTGVSALVKAIPAIALIYTLGKVVDSVVNVTSQNIENYTGYYQFSVGLNNFKTITTNVINPIGMATKYIKTQIEYQKRNNQLEQQKLLVGDSTFRYYKIGI